MKMYVPILAILAVGSPVQADLAFPLFHKAENEAVVALAPADLEHTLSLLYCGSAGKTEEQFETILFTGQTREEVAKRAGEFEPEFPGCRSIRSIWISPELKLTKGFSRATQSQWKFALGQAPFDKGADNAADLINTWYDHKTNGRFANVIDADEITPNTQLVAITLTVFASPWSNHGTRRYFNAHETYSGWFHSSRTKRGTVQFMKSIGDFAYTQDDRFQILSMDFSGANMSMLVFLPRNADQFDECLSRLDEDYYSRALDALKSEHVKVLLPKVNYEVDINWKSVLERGGLTLPFSPGEANFFNINNNRPAPLYVSLLKQRMWIRWDETGAKAEAVTRIVGEPFGDFERPEVSGEPLPFVCNHPFVYAIYNRESKRIYFMGIISDLSQMGVPGSE